MGPGGIRVSAVTRDLACVIKASGELTLATEQEFTAQVAHALAASAGPVLFDVSGLEFVDCRGARALARALHAAAPREASLHGCSQAMRRVLDALGLDLPYAPGLVSVVPVPPRAQVRAGAPSRGETLAAMAQAAQSGARHSAIYGSEVMSRLAATYVELALNSRYRTLDKSDDRGRLLMLSGRAQDLSRQYRQHVVEDAD